MPFGKRTPKPIFGAVGRTPDQRAKRDRYRRRKNTSAAAHGCVAFPRGRRCGTPEQRWRGDREEVVATDISDAALAEARLATYGAHAVSNLPVEWVARCFTVRDDDDARARGDKAAAKGGGGGGGFAYELKEHVRRRVTFARGDARFDVPDGAPFELIACRYAVFL